MTLRERIIKAMKLCAKSREQFCFETKINSCTLHLIFKDKAPVLAEHIQGICEAYPKLNPAWLLMGKGKSLIEKDADYSRFKINIRLLEYKIPLKINRFDEYLFREAGKLVEEKAKYYSQKYGITDSQRLLRFSAYGFATLLSGEVETKVFYRHSINEYGQKYPTTSANQLMAIVCYSFSLKYLLKHTVK